MGDVLGDFVGPFFHLVGDEQKERETLFTIGMVAWNAEITGCEGLIKELKRELPKEDFPEDVWQLVDLLRARKRSHFSWCERYIIDFQLKNMKGGFHLEVCSTPSFSTQVKPRSGVNLLTTNAA